MTTATERRPTAKLVCVRRINDPKRVFANHGKSATVCVGRTTHTLGLRANVRLSAWRSR